MNNIEQEVIILCAVEELIASMVNYEIMSLEGNDPDSNISFKSMTHQMFFNIILVDFLSSTDKKGPIPQTSYLGGLRKISDNPSFDQGGSIKSIKIAQQEFTDWLDQEVEVPIWFPSIQKDIKLNVTRVYFLKMTGDISKHNYLRAIGVAEDLKNILHKSGVDVEVDETLLALSDFYDKFHSDVLAYHSSTIAEFLNNIRWAIYYYLQPELNRSIVWDNSREPPRYQYTYPIDLKSKFAKECYWKLMDVVRREPYFREFKVSRWLKLRY